MSRRRPRLADLGCGGGGAGWGYDLAGFEVTGFDLYPQPHYPFTFCQADMRDVELGGFDAVHVSAPCQLWSPSTLSQRRAGRVYPDLITPMRPRLAAYRGPWVMENVPEAPLRHDLVLCGCQFGLEIPGVGQLLRPRAFEFSWRPVLPPRGHDHRLPAISVCGHGTPAWQRRRTGHIRVAAWREVMGISWTDRARLAEAVPPVYTQLAGDLLMEQVMADAA